LQGFSGVAGVLKLLAMLLLLARTVGTDAVGVVTALANYVRDKRADIIIITAGRVRFELGINRLIGDA
jgi:hypothetical protein